MSWFARCALALVFGAVMTLSFAPANAWWLTPWCMAGLFMLLSAQSAPRAAALGFVFGLGWLGSGVGWLYAGLANFSDSGPALALLLTGALAGWLALFPSLATGAFARMANQGSIGQGPWRWAAGASLWTLSEWARANMFGGFPWLLSGTSHASSPLGALAPTLGVQGAGWVNAWLAVMLADCLQRWQGGSWRGSAAQMAGALSLVVLVCASLCLPTWTFPTGQRVSLRLVQGNIPQYQKVTAPGLADAARIYTRLAGAGSADLTVLPETAFPVTWDAMPQTVTQGWRQLAQARNTALVIGTFGARAGKAVGTNSAMALLPHGTGGSYDYRYDKVHLVPFGEQTWPWTEWITSRMYRQFGALTAGRPGQPALALGRGSVAFGICFESLFDTAIADKARGAGLLVNLSNFGWFDGTYAAAQHLQAGQMRARETGRWFVQVSNSGVTAIVDPHGVVQSSLPAEVLGVLDGDVEMMQGETPFMRFGNTPVVLGCLLLLTGAWFSRRAAHADTAPLRPHAAPARAGPH